MLKILFRIIIFSGIFYNALMWHEQRENKMTEVVKEVFFIDCNSTKNSNIKIIHRGVYKSVGVPRTICRDLELGDKLTLSYSTILDRYSFPGSKSSRNLVFFFTLTFILSFFNFNKFIN